MMMFQEALPLGKLSTSCFNFYASRCVTNLCRSLCHRDHRALDLRGLCDDVCTLHLPYRPRSLRTEAGGARDCANKVNQFVEKLSLDLEDLSLRER
jgi:hypothetical protein